MPPAVRKRPRRGQDPSLRTAPSTGTRTPGRHICRPYSAYVNCIRRAGCPHPAASSRSHPSTDSPHVGGGVPDAPETSCRRKHTGRDKSLPYSQPFPPAASRRRPSPGHLRAGHARPLPRGGGQAPCRPQTPAEGSRPLPTDRSVNGCPHPGNLPSPPIPGTPPGRACPAPTARRGGNGDKKTEAIPFPGTASVLI